MPQPKSRPTFDRFYEAVAQDWVAWFSNPKVKQWEKIKEMVYLLFRVHVVWQVKVDQTLRPRERECLHYMWMGKTTKEIAKRMGITTFTVNFHRRKIKDKLGGDRPELTVLRGIQYGEISTGRLAEEGAQA